MDILTSAAALAAVMVLGLTAGALLAEGGLLVPFWRSLAPEAFLAWYKQHAALLQNFFGPLEIAAGVLTLIAAGLHWGRAGGALLAVAALLTLAVLAVFPLYFQHANTSFARGTIDPASVTHELARWKMWHWGRTILAVGAFGCSILAV